MLQNIIFPFLSFQVCVFWMYGRLGQPKIAFLRYSTRLIILKANSEVYGKYIVMYIICDIQLSRGKKLGQISRLIHTCIDRQSDDETDSRKTTVH